MEDDNHFSSSVVRKRTTAEALKPFISQLQNFRRPKKRTIKVSPGAGHPVTTERYALQGSRHKAQPNYNTVLLSPVTAGVKLEMKYNG